MHRSKTCHLVGMGERGFFGQAGFRSSSARSSKVFYDLVLSIPALLARTALGIVAFRYVNDATFRRIVLIVLLVSGLILFACSSTYLAPRGEAVMTRLNLVRDPTRDFVALTQSGAQWQGLADWP